MKKFVSIILALALVLSMSITAFAADNTNLTITDSDGKTYIGYRLLDLTTSLKDDDQHTDGNHTDDCYNYAYTVNEKYRAVLQAETFANAEDTLWDAAKPATADLVTDTQILDYLTEQSSDSGNSYGTLRTVADRIYQAILDASIAADATDLTGNNDSIAQGYWMFADVTDLDGQNAANSLVVVDTAGQNAITVTPKTALPTIEKKVKDIADSEDGEIKDNPWHDSADHDMNDVVPFKLTATLPNNVMNYQTYTMIFHDDLSAGLTLDAASIKVYMYDTKADADADIPVEAGEDVTAYFPKTTEGLTDGCTFEVRCDDVLEIPGMTATSAFVVYYEATLNEDAVIGAVGNPNEVYLEFSNNPYDEGTGKTEEDKVIVFTYQMVVNKTDADGNPLEGAGFTLYKKNAEGTYVKVKEELKGDDMTTFTWIGLDDGEYKLEETTVPEGYNKMDAIEFTISAEHSELADDPALISLDGGEMGTGTVATGVIEKDIVNLTGTVLPETGAKGTMMLITTSTMLVIVAAVFMITRKKMSVYED